MERNYKSSPNGGGILASNKQKTLSDETLNLATAVKPLQLAGMKDSLGVSVNCTDFSPQSCKAAGHELRLQLHGRAFQLLHHSCSA